MDFAYGHNEHMSFMLELSSIFNACTGYFSRNKITIQHTLAMAMSSCSVLVLHYSSIHTKRDYKGTFQLAVSLTIWALVAMVVAFITGTYAVLGGHSPGIAVAACVLGCIFFSVFANSLLSSERKLLKAPHFLDDMVGDFNLLMDYSFYVIISSLVGFFVKMEKIMNKD